MCKFSSDLAGLRSWKDALKVADLINIPELEAYIEECVETLTNAHSMFTESILNNGKFHPDDILLTVNFFRVIPDILALKNIQSSTRKQLS